MKKLKLKKFSDNIDLYVFFFIVTTIFYLVI